MGKRVIISVTNDLSTDQRVHRVASSLHAAGWQVLVVGRRLKHSPALGGRPYATARMRLIFTRGKLFYLSFNIRLFFFLLFRPAHTLLANDLDTLLPNWMVARLRGKCLVYDSHEYWTELPELIGRPRTRAIWLWLEKRLFPRVDAAMTVNDSIAHIYKESYGLPVLSLRNLPQRLHHVREREAGGHVLLYQGALNVGRGIELMIAAMQHLPAQYRLRLLGSGPMSDALKALVRELKLEERVEMPGHVPFDRLPAQTQQAALGMSLEEDLGASYRFASPNKLFDYIQSGLPVLVSDLPEMRALVAAHGMGEILPAEQRNPADLAMRIRAMCENADTWRRYHRRSLEAAAALCWENEAGKLLALFGEGR